MMNTRVIIILSFVSLMIASISACSKSNAAENSSTPPRQVTAVEVKAAPFQEKIKASGRLSAKEEANLSFKTGGVIHKILVKEGQKVRKGQLLATLEMDEIDAQVEKAALAEEKAGIDLDNAKLALQLAKRDYRNTKALYEDSVATLEQLENVEVQLQNAKNQLNAAQTGLSLNQQNKKVADYNQQYSKIVAPGNGTILRKMSEVNEIVGPSKPIFLFGSRDQAQVIKISVTDKDVIHLNLGDPAEVNFDAYPGLQFKGIVREIAGNADPYTGTYEVEVEVDAANTKLLSGFIGRVEIATQTKEDLIRLDASALIAADGNEGSVFVVKDKKVSERKVQIFKLDGSSLLIKNGLNPGEQVVTSGAGYLEEGQQVRVVE